MESGEIVRSVAGGYGDFMNFQKTAGNKNGSAIDNLGTVLYNFINDTRSIKTEMRLMGYATERKRGIAADEKGENKNRSSHADSSNSGRSDMPAHTRG